MQSLKVIALESLSHSIGMINIKLECVEGSQAFSHMDTKSPRCSATSNGRSHPLFIEGGPKLAVTLKTRENRVLADCPPHKNQTVRHSNPTARTAMIMCQSRPLEPRADCPHPWGGPSAVQNFEPTNLQTSLTKSRSDRRTVRSPGADRPQFKK